VTIDAGYDLRFGWWSGRHGQPVAEIVPNTQPAHQRKRNIFSCNSLGLLDWFESQTVLVDCELKATLRLSLGCPAVSGTATFQAV
jgi:hypothetical protein